MFARNEQLLAYTFNASSGTLSGVPQTLAKDVANDPTTWHVDAAASNGGLLIYGRGAWYYGSLQFLWMDRASKKLSSIAEGLTNVQEAFLSPQGDRLAVQIANGVSDIWVLDVVRGTRTRLTFGPVNNTGPHWSPDGKWIVYASDRNGRWQRFRKPSDGGGAEEELLNDDQILYGYDWSRDGKYILYQRGQQGSQAIWALPLEGDRKPYQVVPGTPNTIRTKPVVSPDGRWMAYVSSESGTMQVYVVGFQGGHGKWQVSTDGGDYPVWGHDGKELFYSYSGNSIYAVPVKEVAGALQFGGSHEAIVSGWTAANPWFQVSADGKKILLYRVSQDVSDSLTVVTNFTSTLKK